MSKYQPIRSVQRAIRILSIVNGRERMTLSEIAKEAGLPKTTVFRFLETLEIEGLVERDSNGSRYSVGRAAQRLSSGYKELPLLERTKSKANEITKKTKWPCVVATPKGSQMEVIHTTHERTPMVMWLDAHYTRMPMLDWALGRSYLAFCEQDVRERHFDLIDQDRFVSGQELLNRTAIHESLSRQRDQGYGFRASSKSLPSSSIGVPILDGSEILGSIVLNYFGKSLSAAEAVKEFLPLLRDAGNHPN